MLLLDICILFFPKISVSVFSVFQLCSLLCLHMLLQFPEQVNIDNVLLYYSRVYTILLIPTLSTQNREYGFISINPQ